MLTAHPRIRRHPSRIARRLLVVPALALAGCGDSRVADRGDSTAQAPAPAPAVGAPGVAADSAACPLTGAWRPCSVKDRLEKAGLAPRLEQEGIRRPGFAVPGSRYAIGDASLEVFLYASPADRLRDVAALDSATASPRGTRTDWPKPPTLMGSGNLAAVLHGARERQVERVALALTAGLPEH